MKSYLERKSRVFIVDDHPLVRDGLTTLINQQDDLAVCGSAGDYVAARSGIAAAQPHVVLVDVSLGNRSGLQLIKDLRADQPDLAAVVLSMHDEMLYADRALRAGARGYVMKCESTKNVLTAIRRVLEGGVYLSDNVVNRMARQVAGDRARTSASTGRVEQLSDRELQIFRLIGRGLTTSEIAQNLHLSMKTVQAYCARAKEKLGLTTAVELRRTATLWEEAHAVEMA